LPLPHNPLDELGCVLAVAEHIANRGSTSSDWNELVHYIDVANLAIKSDAS